MNALATDQSVSKRYRDRFQANTMPTWDGILPSEERSARVITEKAGSGGRVNNDFAQSFSVLAQYQGPYMRPL